MKRNNLDIILIEQMAEMNGVLLSILHELNYFNIRLFKDVKAAWQQIHQSPPDLIICDWYSDKKDTLQLLKQVRGDELDCYIPFIIVSGIVEHDMVNQAIAIGVDEYIVKPYNINIFEDKILKATHLRKEKPLVVPQVPTKHYEEFQTKTALCIRSTELLIKVKETLKNFVTTEFDSLSDVVDAAKNDILIDVVVIEDKALGGQEQEITALTNLIATGQIEVITLIKCPNELQQIQNYKKLGLRQFVFTQIDLEELKTKAELLTTLKKALLHTKDTINQASKVTAEKSEIQNSLLKKIQKEASGIKDKSEQILSTSKQSSFAHQLSKDIYLSAKNINSISEVFDSLSKEQFELEQSPKEVVQAIEVFNNAQELFENVITQRKLEIKQTCDESLSIRVNPILFSSLFTFIFRAVLVDTRFDSEIELIGYHEKQESLNCLKVKSLMTGYPHLNDVTERVWYDKTGQLQFSLKTAIQSLCDSQLKRLEITFDSDTDCLSIEFYLPSSFGH